MKKASCVLIIVLLLLLEISAKAEWVSIVELRQQVDEMGWCGFKTIQIPMDDRLKSMSCR